MTATVRLNDGSEVSGVTRAAREDLSLEDRIRLSEDKERMRTDPGLRMHLHQRGGGYRVVRLADIEEVSG